MAARTPDDEAERPPIEVLARLLADREAGRLRPLAEYLAQFPGLEEQVAAEYLRVRAPQRGDASASNDGEEPDAPRTLGPYELIRELGRGGQGTVWLARDPRLDREVALKVVPRSPLLGEVSRRFQREARTASQLDHPGLCPVFDVGTGENLAWIAMRYVPGQTLAERLSERDGAPRSAGELAADVLLLERLARALHVAHQAGIVHRDVKPSNVIVTPEGDPVLLDFGIARDDDDNQPLTMTGDSLGTPVYMSPEQLSGTRPDPRTDVWSLGATAYELLGGERPFDAPTREAVIAAVLRTEPEPLTRLNRAVSRDLEVVVSTALSKELDGRYQTALALAEDLERARTGRAIRARPLGPGERLLRWARRNPVIAASVATVFLVLLASLGLSTRLLRQTQLALETNATLLDEVTQLADAKVAEDLLAEEAVLWPATPDRAPAMELWLRRARALESRIDIHHRALANVDERLASNVTAELAGTAETETIAWMKEQLTEIIASIEELLEVLPEMEARHELAATLYDATIASYRAEWEAAATRVAADRRFEGLELVPQLGLIPLGPDRDSGLEEFAHLPSGAVPERAPQTHELLLTDQSAVVLVLIPGGATTVGCDPPGPGRPVGDPLVDPQFREIDGPVRLVRLDPFLISKYEMTTSQWERQAGIDPSIYSTHPELSGIQPVEQVDNRTVVLVLAQLGLSLPTDPQWERAARADTTTVWYTGDDPHTLAGHANLADEGSRATGPPRWEYISWLRDGFLATAPVGSLAPNPFGLYDIHGNVCEWTSTPWLSLHEYPPRDGDGQIVFERMGARVVRGGSFAKPELYARSGHRDGLPGHLFAPDIGLRPARALEVAAPIEPQAAR